MWRPLLFLLFQIYQATSEIRIISEPRDFTGFMTNFNMLKYEVAGATNPGFEWHQNGSVIPEDSSGIARGRDFYGQRSSRLMTLDHGLRFQGVYQVYISSSWGRIFGREIKVEFTFWPQAPKSTAGEKACSVIGYTGPTKMADFFQLRTLFGSGSTVQLYRVVGQFPDQESVTVDVVIGQSLRIPCPPHGFTRNAVYKWGGYSQIQGTWLIQRKNVAVMDDGTLFFSHVTEDDVELIRQKNGIRCLLDPKKTTTMEPSAPFHLNVTGTNKTTFGPIMEKIPDKEVVQGNYVVLRCIAAGYPTPTYRWEKTDNQGVTKSVFNRVDGIELQDNMLIIANVRKNLHPATYKCYATIEVGGKKKVAEEQSILTVTEKPAWVEDSKIKSAQPEILSQHVWKCVARGDPQPGYSWYANASRMVNESGRYTVEGGTLTFHRLTLADNGMYQCVARNKFGSEYQTVSMAVKVKKPEITSIDKEITLVPGTTGKISCQSDALPVADHHWLFNGVQLRPNKTAKYELTEENDLLIHNSTNKDGGVYTCVATNMFGKAEANVTAKIGEIRFKTRPQENVDVKKGEQFSLSCEAEEEPLLDILYKWRFQEQPLSMEGDVHELAYKNQQLFVSRSRLNFSGVYECVAYVTKPVYAEKVSSATVIVRGVPDPPQDLTLHGSCTNFTANISWAISYRNPYDPLTTLLLQWSTSHDTITWYNVTGHVNASSNSHVVHGLNPWSNIRFRLVAINKHGASKPSEVTQEGECKTPATRPTTCPAGVQGTATKPQTIEVTWKEVPVINRNGPGFGYIVSYRKRHSSSWQRQAIPHGSERRSTISNTGADQEWEFTVQSKNVMGTGPNCTIETATSAKEAPSLAPQSFRYTELGARSVGLAWEPISGPDQTVLGYKLNFWQKSIGNVRRRRSHQENPCNSATKPCDVVIPGGNTSDYKLENLLPYKAYTLMLRGYSEGGDGPASDPLRLNTAQDTPGRPHHVRFTPFGKYIKMSWKPPKQPNGVITGYVAEIQSGELKELDGNTKEYLFRNLTPVHEYVVQLKAKTAAGPGRPIVKLVNTTALRVPAVPAPPDVEGINGDSVNVTYNPGDGQGGWPEKFYVVYKEKDGDDLRQTNQTWINGDGKAFIVVSGLDNDKKYLFATIVTNGEHKSNRSEFTEGHPIPVQASSSPTPIYRRYWFYIILALILLLVLLLILLLLIRRKPKRTYKVSEREKKHAAKDGSIELAEEQPLKAPEPSEDEPPPQGKMYDPIKPQKPVKRAPDEEMSPSPPDKEPRLTSNPELDSLDAYDGEDDDFSEHGSFIGQYGTGGRGSASQSSLPTYV